MKHIAGSFLIALSIVCMAATVLLIVLSRTDWPENPTEDDWTSFIAFLMFAGVLFALEVVMLLCGRYLRHPCPGRVAEKTPKHGHRRLLPLIVYLGGSIGIAILASLGTRVLPQIKALGFLIGQPQVFAQLILGGLLGIKLDGGIMTHAIMAAANLLYFPALFYPVYRIATMDRAVEVVSYRRMKTLLILFASVHILMALVLAMLLKA
jgi:hypothetical protein